MTFFFLLIGLVSLPTPHPPLLVFRPLKQTRLCVSSLLQYYYLVNIQQEFLSTWIPFSSLISPHVYEFYDFKVWTDTTNL